MEANQKAFDQDALVWEGRPADPNGLLKPEQLLLHKYAGEIATGRVLDLGVGGGRTAIYLLPRCRHYQAIDYAPAMIDLCRGRFLECGADLFTVADARDLSFVDANSVDLVLFSYNGMDYVGHKDRLKVIAEIHRVLRRDGLFIFSSHSLHAFPFRKPDVQALNANVDAEALRLNGWSVLVDSARDLSTYYIYPHQQIAQLEAFGFSVIDVLDMAACPFSFSNPPSDWMVHFAARSL